MLFKFRIIEAMAFVTNIALWSDFIIPGEICRILGGILKLMEFMTHIKFI